MENIFILKKNYSETQLYEKLITQIYKELYRFIYVIVRNTHIAEDVLQDTLVQGYKHFNDLKDKEKFKSWIFTIAKREALKVLRRNSREQISEEQECERLINKDFYMGEFIEPTSELHDALTDIINNLDSESKDIIYLIYYADLSLDEIAGILNMNYNTLKSKHKRIKERIYKELLKCNLTKANNR